MAQKQQTLSYLVTVSRAHFLPAQMLFITLRKKTANQIVVVGNLDVEQVKCIEALGATYLDEDSIDLSGRLPRVSWQKKFREFGWYKQMFLRLSIDRFMATDQVVILDSEVFVFDNWDECRFYDPTCGAPRCFYWIPKKRKSDWDYQMYRGAAYLLSFLPGYGNIIEYANSDSFKRHISGVVLFSTKNVEKLWYELENHTDLQKNIDRLFNQEESLAFSDHDFYGLAAEYGMFGDTVPTVMYNGLLGWYDNHDDENFHLFKKDAMWSMCQGYQKYPDPTSYQRYMEQVASLLNLTLPSIDYWNPEDRGLIIAKYDAKKDIQYFEKYEKQLDYTFRKRFRTFYTALTSLVQNKQNPTIVEIGTLRDNTKGGGHSTYKFGEFCSRFGGTVHTVDISPEAIRYAMRASSEYQPWIKYHVSDSVEFLKHFEGTIDFLYLDGFDSTPGQELAASQKQLEEIIAALPKLSPSAMVLLDDADLPEGGKAKFSSEYLKEHRFTLVIDSYQQLFTAGLNPPLTFPDTSLPPSPARLLP
ncbi:MAG: hypothetical protein A2W05_04995 [Candidatus Schekmanbacteria bacterium RBG_16_38_10]|uniref:Methyltransferase domain-containing protein n=1 Tax=Candidatus Schekmanbacteria bacterium RBG_16_38_10 TaxID=1817879 RepID=A0A1F7RNK2_9BACT|nr:MAG: hypothetical protein A2W05_04995 [Candidatus Schekmanbacteria bacterium RBG_16_38_10]